jgi:hypothetical protein
MEIAAFTCVKISPVIEQHPTHEADHSTIALLGVDADEDHIGISDEDIA